MDDETTHDEPTRRERTLDELIKILEAENQPRPPVVEWVTEPLPVENAPGTHFVLVTLPDPEPESAPEPAPAPMPNGPVPDAPVPDAPSEAWQVARPGNNVGRPRQRPAPPLSLVQLPPDPPAPAAPPMCTTLDFNRMWLRLSIWPMVAPLLRASIVPDDEVAVWRTLTESGFPPSIIRGYLPEVLADLRQRLEEVA